jgi:mono/diheme cytochrome c family protein
MRAFGGQVLNRESRFTMQDLTPVVLAVVLVSCRQDMHDQPKHKPLSPSEFYTLDHRSARPAVPGTVARGHLEDDSPYYTGKNGALPTETLPMTLTPELLQRGQVRFQTFCAPCHGRTGRGDGMIVQRGFKPPPSLHVDRLREAPVGYFYDVITHGFGAMSDYAAQVPVADRWAITAYVRALQLSQRASLADVPAEKRDRLDQVGVSAEGASGAHHP